MIKQSLATAIQSALLAICLLLLAGLPGCHKVPTHTVTLTWQAPADTAGVQLVGYNVYRSTAPSRQFVRIASRVPGSSYEDRLVLRGRTYIYVVTAIDQAGRESMFSAEAEAVIP